MEPLYIEESIKKAKAAIQTSPDITPFDLHRILSNFEENIAASLSDIRSQSNAFQAIQTPTTEQAKEGSQRMEELAIQLRSLAQATKALEEINTCGILSYNETLNFLEPFIRANTERLNLDLSLLQEDLQKTLSRYRLQKDFLLYKESLSFENPLMLANQWTPHQIAGQYLYTAGGDRKKAMDLLLGVTEEIYSVMGNEAFLSNKGKNSKKSFLEAMSLLTDHPAADPPHIAPQMEIDPVSDIPDREEEVDPNIPIPPEFEQNPDMDEPALDSHSNSPCPEPSADPAEMELSEEDYEGGYADEEEEHSDIPNMTIPQEFTPQEPQISEPTANIAPEAEPIPQQTKTEEQPSTDAPSLEKEPVPQSEETQQEAKTMTLKEYYAFRDEHTRLTQDYETALNRRMAIQREVGDFSNATKDQIMKWTQSKTAVDEVHAKLKEASAKLDQLNRDIRAGKTILLRSNQKNKQTQREQTRQTQSSQGS